jgi:hypothetical protein
LLGIFGGGGGLAAGSSGKDITVMAPGTGGGVNPVALPVKKYSRTAA